MFEFTGFGLAIQDRLYSQFVELSLLYQSRRIYKLALVTRQSQGKISSRE